jgi:16S rRNA (cytidine1402-2'-O)-methyltransferase
MMPVKELSKSGMTTNKPGILYLVPVLLGETSIHDVLPEKTIQTASKLACFIAENAKSARHFLKQLPLTGTLQEIEVLELDKHSGKIDFNYYFAKLRSGIDTGLVSEAGMPGIADPGSAFVLQAHKEGIQVVPLTGPSSLFLALAASGMNGQGFLFHGYLPKEKEDRSSKIKLLEKNAERFRQTQIFIETPYRNQALFTDLLQLLNPGTLLCLAADVTLPTEFIKTMTVGEWRKKTVDLNKRPCVFLIL